MKVGLILAVEAGRTDFPALGIGFLAASVRAQLPEVEVVIKERLDDLLAESPDVLGISASTDTYHIALRWAEEIKAKSKALVVIGGIHISLLPASLEPCFDVAVIGEGELTFVDLLQSVLEHGGLERRALRSIAGLAFCEDAGVHVTAQRALTRDLDQLPLPNRRELPFHHEGGRAHVFSARGCPYDCSFCASARFFGRYRCHSVQTVADDIDLLINEEKASFIVFYDDLFIARKSRLRELIEQLEARKLIGKCQYMGHVRANLIDDEVCELLKRLGMDVVSMGLETFSDSLLSFYNKRGVTAAVNQRALDVLARHGINVLSLFMFGAPVETADDVHETLEAIYANLEAGKIGDGQWGALVPYPGTALWDSAREAGVVHEKMDWRKFSAQRKSELYIGKLPRQELLSIIDEWKTKFSLLVPNRSANTHTNLFINDEDQVRANALEIVERHGKALGSRRGDDLLVQAAASAPTARPYSFLKHYERGTLLEGASGQAAVWQVMLNGRGEQAVFLHPPARLRFDVPSGAAGVFSTALAIHPDAWSQPAAAACRFLLSIDGELILDEVLDTASAPAQRRWHDVLVDVSRTASPHSFVLETRPLGTNLHYCWALWRAPLWTPSADDAIIQTVAPCHPPCGPTSEPTFSQQPGDSDVDRRARRADLLCGASIPGAQLVAKVVDGERQALLSGDLGLPAQLRLRLANVRTPPRGVIDRERLVDEGRARVRLRDDHASELADL